MFKSTNGKKSGSGKSAFSRVISALTVVIMILLALVSCDSNFDYIKSDLTKYVELSSTDYKNYTLEISLAEPHDIDVDVALLNLVSSEKYRKQEGDGGYVRNLAPTPGDRVVIRYRGYIINSKGEEVTVSTSMSNIAMPQDTEIQIGDDNTSFLPVGFELGLIGKNPEDYAKFEQITSGKAQDDWVVYVSFDRLVEGGDAKKDTLKATTSRIDLSDTEEADKVFGEGFVEKIKSFEIGQTYNNIVLKINGKNYEYNNFVVKYATTCEKASTSENGKAPLVVEGYFPYYYGLDGTATAGLRNDTVYYQVFIQKVQPFSTPELNDEFILQVVGEKDSAITEAELREYEGETLVDKYRSYAKEAMKEAYETTYADMVEDAIWDHYLQKAIIKKYPEKKVREIYNKYIADVEYQYDYNGGALTNSDGDFVKYQNIDEFAIAYLKLSDDDDWKDVLYKMSEDLVKERLILYYIMQKEGIVPTEENLSAKTEEIKNEYLEEYVKQYLEYTDKTEEDYTDEEYKKFLEDRKEEIFGYYDEPYFKETAYYEIALEKFRTYVTVYTLDNPKPAETE